MKLIVHWERGEHHSGGESSWTGIEAVEYDLPHLKVTHLKGNTFYIDYDEIKSFKVEEYTPPFSELKNSDGSKEVK